MPIDNTPCYERDMHKERGKQKENLPPTPPLREKKREKENLPSPPPSNAGAGAGVREGACAHAQGKGKGEVDSFNQSFEIRPRVRITITDEFIRGFVGDLIQLSMAVLRMDRTKTYRGRVYNNPRLLRKIMRQIGEDVFREVLIQQWHENRIDGEPKSREAAFFAKLYAVRDEIMSDKGGVR